MDLKPIQPVFAAVASVGDADGGDDVGVQQVHPPPGVVQLRRVGARAHVEAGVTVSVDGVVGGPKVVGVTPQLGGLPTQSHVLCGGSGRRCDGGGGGRGIDEDVK